MMTDNAQPLIHSGIACLTMLLRFHKLAANPEQIAREYVSGSGAVDWITLTRAAKQLGLKARAVQIKAERLTKTPLPAIGQDQQGAFFILARVNDTKALLQRPGEVPQEMTITKLLAMWSSTLLLATTTEKLVGDERAFDITWFIRPLLRVKTPVFRRVALS